MGSQSTLFQHPLSFGGNARLVHLSGCLNVLYLCLCDKHGSVLWNHFMSDEVSSLLIKQKEDFLPKQEGLPPKKHII